MGILHTGVFHEKKLKVNHRFDLFKQIDFYEKLWNGKKSAYKDYQQTKENILSLKPSRKKPALPPAVCRLSRKNIPMCVYTAANRQNVRYTSERLTKQKLSLKTRKGIVSLGGNTIHNR